MSEKTSIVYREFYDVPRMIVLRREGSLILLESVFDTETDDYSDRYKVFLLPNISEDELQGSWEGLSSKASKSLGEILVRVVEFDRTLRKEIDTGLINELLREASAR